MPYCSLNRDVVLFSGSKRLGCFNNTIMKAFSITNGTIMTSEVEVS